MKIWKCINENFEKWILGTLVALIVLVLLMQIVMRYFFNISLPWTEEFCRYCYIYFMFIGTSLAAKEDSSLRVDALVGAFPPKVQKVISLFVDVCVMLLLVYLLAGSIAMTRNLYATGGYSAGLKVPVYLVYLAAPLGFFLTLLRYLQKLYHVLTGRDQEVEKKC